jgi:hypothetical protein
MQRTHTAIIMGILLSSPLLAQTPAGIDVIPFDAKMPAPNTLPQTAGPHPQDISGYWEIRDIPGYRRGRNAAPGAIALTPEGQAFAQKAAADRQRQTGDPSVRVIVPTASRYCEPMGMPFIMAQSPPISIVQAKNETLIFSEQHGSPRHIYTDGRSFPPEGELENTTNGNSTGHWEGDTLIVETTGFSDQYGMRNLPGGVLINPKTHLVERFHLIDDGKLLSYEATYTDPNLYAKPATDRWLYFREGPDAFAIDETCDAGDSLQGASVQVAAPTSHAKTRKKY